MISIRRATAADATRISTIAIAAYSRHAERLGRVLPPMVEDYAATIRDCQVSVAERGGAIVGMVVLATTGEGFLLDNVAVDPECRGQGIGRVLIEFAEAEALRQGYDRIHLYTNERMPENVALYARNGYIEYDRRAEKGVSRVYMRKSLG